MGKKPLTTELWILFCKDFYIVRSSSIKYNLLYIRGFFYMIFTRRNMFSENEIREILPCPIRIEICSATFFLCIHDLIKKLREKYNKNRDTKIEKIIVDYIEEDLLANLEYNQFKIYVGKKLIHEGIAPFLIEKNENQNNRYKQRY